MNIEIWSKSFLSIYSILPELTTSIDRLVLSSALCSANSYSEDAFTQSDKVAKLSQFKVNLINLKLLADKAILSMPEDLAKLLITRYIDGISLAEAIKLSGESKRNYFRKLGSAFKSFQKIFLQKARESKRAIYSTFQNEFWDSIFNKINIFNGKGGEVHEYPEAICNLILNQMRKVV